jgi:hypothetical protein
MTEKKYSANQQDIFAEKCRQALEKSYGMKVPMPKRQSKNSLTAFFQKWRN